MEDMVKIYIAGKMYEVPASLTIMNAMEYAGYQHKRGCGCRAGFCGACATIYRIKGAKEHQQQADFEQTELFREKAKVRYKIEAKNAELKNVFGYDRADSYGIDCMRMQGAMVIFAANIKRILKLG